FLSTAPATPEIYTLSLHDALPICLSVLQPAYTMAAAIANEFSEATTNLYLSALFEVGLILFVITVAVNGLARLLIWRVARGTARSEEHTSELQSRGHLVCRLLLEK